MPSVELGPFILQRPVGKGGMAEVWRGYHREQQVPVAVKVMTAAVFAKPENLERFQNEVRSVARLDHPGVVYVFDHGTVTAEAARAARGRLTEGAPYLAMEYASGGSLADPHAVTSWRAFREVLLALLDALAHAHAHGVVHRDIKPANVLLSGPRDLRPGLKLTDFGIAMAETNQDGQDEVVGTLHYMSPEQIRAAAWMQGPHTDLYALGCLAWRIACGQLPFQGRRGVSLLAAQLHQPLPDLTPLMLLPPMFEDWLKALTAKHPADRFRRAADAAAALEQLGEPEGTPIPARSRLPIEEQPTVLDLHALRIQTRLDPESTPIARFRSPVTSDWRRPGGVLPNVQLMGAGLGLFGVRQVPLVGREHERDSIWNALRDVHRTGQARAVLIRGAAGAGKSRLASWLCIRAHEIGSASVLQARFHESGTAEAPLQRMLHRSLRPPKEEQDDAEFAPYWLRFWRSTRTGISDALAALLDPPATLDATSRHALLRMLLEEIARERPVIVWLDDVQWGLDGLRFAQSVLDSQAMRSLPVLLLLTARDEALAIRDQERARLRDLMAHPTASTIRLRPLNRTDRSRLVQKLLLLEPALGAAVEERSAGNPLFAVQLVGNWVQRGMLVPSERGFKLREGSRPNLPADLSQVWNKRVDQLLTDLPNAAGWILEAAAVIGPEVEHREWRTVCDDPEHGTRALNPVYQQIRRQILERLLEGRLAERTDAGWVFAHGLLQETLQERARHNGRWTQLNRAAARMLERAKGPQVAERLGQHLVEAKEIQAAIQPLLEGAQHRRVSVGRRSALRLLQTCEEAMRDLLPPSAPEWARLWDEKAVILYLLGQHDEARAVANQMLAGALDHNWRGAEPLGAFRLGRIAHDAGDLYNAEKWFELARELATDDILRAEAGFHLSRVAHSLLQPTRAHALQVEATTLLEGTDDLRLRAMSAIFLAEASWDDGDMQACGVHAQQALDLAITLSDLGLQVRCWNFLSESARARGDLVEAAAHLNQGINIADMVGDARTPLLRANLGLVYLTDHDYSRATQVLQEGYFQAEQLAQPPLLAILRALLVEAAAGQGNWAAFDDHTTAAERLQFDLQTGELDCAAALRRAASVAAEAGEKLRALRAAQLSADHYTKLGKLDARKSVLAEFGGDN